MNLTLVNYSCRNCNCYNSKIYYYFLFEEEKLVCKLSPEILVIILLK